MNHFEIVKKYIDTADYMGLLDMFAPSDEYDIESKMIADRISEKSTESDIAKVIAEVFFEMFGKREDASFYLPVAQGIFQELNS